MESDSLPSAISLVVALGAFLFVSLAEASLVLSRQPGSTALPLGLRARLVNYVLRRAPSYAETAVVLRLAATAASTVAVVALVVALVQANWGAISLGALGLWLLLAAMRAAAQGVVARWSPNLWAWWVTAVLVALWPFIPMGWAITRLRRPRRLPSHTVPLAEDGGPAEAVPSPLADEGREHAAPELTPRERSMIRAILRLGKTTVQEIMTPRVDIVVAEVETPLSQMVALMVQSGHSRLPVFEDTMDNIVGIAYARDLMASATQPEGSATLRDLARPAYFVPEFKRVDELLQELQETGVHVALVVDEYGGIAGLVTIEDLLEEIVGDIVDEFDVEEPEVERVSENEVVMDARVSLDVVNSLFDIHLSGEGFATLGGFVYSRLGKMPSPGDEVVSDGLTLRILSTAGRRIKKVQVMRAGEGGGPPE